MASHDSASAWPAGARVAQLCITRATRDLPRLLAFYRDALGLPVLFQFDAGGGSAGAMVGLPGRELHLELLQLHDAVAGPASPHDVLVLHLPDAAHRQALADRLRAAGHEPVAPANPYWADKALVFEDPDGWPLVLAHGAGLPG